MDIELLKSISTVVAGVNAKAELSASFTYNQLGLDVRDIAEKKYVDLIYWCSLNYYWVMSEPWNNRITVTRMKPSEIERIDKIKHFLETDPEFIRYRNKFLKEDT